MRTWAKLAAFAITLAVVFVVALAIGAAVGPIDLGGGLHGDDEHSIVVSTGEHGRVTDGGG